MSQGKRDILFASLGGLTFGVLFLAVVWMMASLGGCANPTVKGDRSVDFDSLPSPVIPQSPMGPPAPIEIDQDTLAGQIVAKLEARLQVMLSAVANVASGNTTYFSWAVAAVMALGWGVQARATKLQSDRAKQQLERDAKIIEQLITSNADAARWSNEREMERIKCGKSHGV